MAQTPSDPSYTHHNDEVDLVDYLKVILARKWVVIIVTSLCVVGAFIYKQLEPPVPQQYEAKATLLVKPPPLRSDLLPKFSSQIYQRLAEAQDLKKAVLDSLFARTGQMVTLEALDSALNVLVVSRQEGAQESGSILLDFKVTSKDTLYLHPVLVSKVWATLFLEKNRGFTSNEAVGSYSYINEQYLQVKRNLEDAEEALTDFQKKNNLAALKLEWDAVNGKLTEYQTTYVNIDIQLRDLENGLRETERAIASYEMPDGTWVGSLILENAPKPTKLNLTTGQKSVLNAVVQARQNLFQIKEKIRLFQLENPINLEANILADQHTKLIAYLNELSQLNVDAGAVHQALQDHKKENWSAVDLPTESGITEAGIRELVALKTGYNLPNTRQKYVLDEIERIKNETDSLNHVHSKHVQILENLTEAFKVASENHQVFLAQYTALKKRRSELVISLSTLKPDVLFHRREITNLMKRVKTLQHQIAMLETRQVRLTREQGLYQANFEKFAKLLEDARIAKAAQPEDIKLVAVPVGLQALPKESKSLSLALAAIVGVILSVFVAFFIEYWVQAQKRLQVDA